MHYAAARGERVNDRTPLSPIRVFYLLFSRTFAERAYAGASQIRQTRVLTLFFFILAVDRPSAFSRATSNNRPKISASIYISIYLKNFFSQCTNYSHCIIHIISKKIRQSEKKKSEPTWSGFEPGTLLVDCSDHWITSWTVFLNPISASLLYIR